MDVAFCGAKTKAHRDPSGLYMRKIPMKITPICLTMNSGSTYLFTFLSLTHVPIPIQKVHYRAIEAVRIETKTLNRLALIKFPRVLGQAGPTCAACVWRGSKTVSLWRIP